MIKAIYKTGSNLYLDNGRDTDLVYYYETKEECIEAIKAFKGKAESDIHFDYVRPVKVGLWCYLYRFMELVEGEDLHLADFSIFDHKEEYINCLKKFVGWLPKDNKWWYHILTACYMFENNSYELTKAQLKDIQRTHDKGITDAKYNYCLKQLDLTI